MLLADIGDHQTFELSVSVELSGTAGYVDKNNYWLVLANRTSDDYELWDVSGGTFTKRASGGSVSAGTHALSCEVRSGRIEKITGMSDYSATIPAGQVGVWAGSGSASVKFDDFVALSMNSMVDIDGRWWDDVDGTSLVSGKLEFSSADDVEQHAIRRGFRGGKYVFEYDHLCIPKTPSAAIRGARDRVERAGERGSVALGFRDKSFARVFCWVGAWPTCSPRVSGIHQLPGELPASGGPHVSVMQPAELGNRDHAPFRFSLDSAWHWRIPIQR